MSVSPIGNAYKTVMNGIDKAYDQVGKFLDKHPTLYKIVQFVNHFFRAFMMFGLMVFLPLPMPLTAGIMLGGTLLYRAAVERFCCFRFAIPSLVGSCAMWLARLSIINFVSGVALSSIGLAIAFSLAFLPLLGYTAWVVYISHRDIENRMAQIKPLEKPATSCCGCDA